MIQVTCPNVSCGKQSAVQDEYAGKKAKCPACGTIMNIPNAAVLTSAARAESAVVPPSVEKPGTLAKIQAWRARLPQWPAVVMVNFGLGGLSVFAGLLISMIPGKLAAAKPVIRTRNMSAEQAEHLAQEFVKLHGPLTTWTVTYFAVLGILMLIWGVVAVCDGYIFSRVAWSRLFTLALAGFAGVLGLLSILPVFWGYYYFVFFFGAYLGYAAWQLLVLTKPRVTRQPS